MHPVFTVVAFVAALVTVAVVWDHLFYVDARDPKRRWRWRRNASADDQAILCHYCLDPIESRADLARARERYLGIGLEWLHARCARELARTGRWKIRRGAGWVRLLIYVTVLWATFAGIAIVVAPDVDWRSMGVALAAGYAGVLGGACVSYLTVERRLPKTGRRREAAPSTPPPAAPAARLSRGRTDLQEAMLAAVGGLIVILLFAPGPAPSFRSLDRLEGTVARTWLTQRGRQPRTLHFELRTTRGLVHVKHNTDHSQRTERQLMLPAGEPVTVWTAPSRLFDRAKVWQLEHDGRLLVAYEEVVAARALERVEIGALMGVFLVVGVAIWLFRIFRPAPGAGGRVPAAEGRS